MWEWHGHFHRKCDHQGSHMVRSIMPKEGGDLSYICYKAVAQLVRPKEKEKKDNLTLSVVIKKRRKIIIIVFEQTARQQHGEIIMMLRGKDVSRPPHCIGFVV